MITVPEVINEIKNKRQLKRLCVLPYDLVVDEPSPESVKHVIEFAKKTGDYLSLSSADLKVIALTYQLERDLNGTDHLRSDPIVAKTIASKQKPVELLDSKPLVGFYNPPTSDDDLQKKQKENRELMSEKIEEEEKEAAENKANDSESDSEDSSSEDEKNEEAVQQTKSSVEVETEGSVKKTEEELVQQLSKLDCGLVSQSDADQILVSVKDKSASTSDEESDESEDEEDSEGADDEDDDESSWITPRNVTEMKNACNKDTVVDIQVRVACMSTDYAVQNVLKQINLNIAALDGRIIKQMRTYILRCYACFKTTSIMTKLFCPNCGHKTLKRVAVSMNEEGQQVIHINLRRPLTGKGKNQSIPRPRGGKHSSNPILFEDQPIPKQFPSRVARTKTNALDEDYIAGISPFVARDVDSKSALLRAKNSGNIKQWARNHAYRNMKRSSKK